MSVQVEGLDEDNAQVMVKLTLSRYMATASQYVVKLVSKKEYDRYSKYLSEWLLFFIVLSLDGQLLQFYFYYNSVKNN